jgi:erythromycin esterase-like protein
MNHEQMIIPPAQPGSWEDFMHQAGQTDKLLIFNEDNHHLFKHLVGHRAIGVVYNPKYEHYGNYVPSSMSERYNAFIYINDTKALQPLDSRKSFFMKQLKENLQGVQEGDFVHP